MATTIRIAETTHPSHPNNTDENTATNPAVIEDGVYNMRSFTRTATGSSAADRDGIYNMRAITRTFSRSSSKDKRGFKGGEKEPEDDDPGLRQSGDFKSRQVCGMHSTACNRHKPHSVNSRSSTANCCCGSPISQSVSSMVTLEPVHSMSTRPPLRRRQSTMTSSASCLSFSGLLP